MNRYAVFQLVQELGRLIAGAHEKTPEEVARDLIACGTRRLAEAEATTTVCAHQSTNGTAIPLPSIEVVDVQDREGTDHLVAPSVPTGIAEA